jgi:hypothetical protein
MGLHAFADAGVLARSSPSYADIFGAAPTPSPRESRQRGADLENVVSTCRRDAAHDATAPGFQSIERIADIAV